VHVATWNCEMGLSSHWLAIARFDADLIAIQGCREGTPGEAEAHGWSCEFQPDGRGKGLAILARPPYTLGEREPSDAFMISTVVCGGVPFRFVDFWAMDPQVTSCSYTQQATRLIETLSDDGIPTIVAGDFNASKSEAHLANVHRLRDRGLVSAYHRDRGRDHADPETEPTSYHLWDESHPFHMDFVFLPADWTIRSVEVGSYDDYCGCRLSDHVPVVVTAEPTASASDGRRDGGVPEGRPRTPSARVGQMPSSARILPERSSWS
jgi:hypothetical protein